MTTTRRKVDVQCGGAWSEFSPLAPLEIYNNIAGTPTTLQVSSLAKQYPRESEEHDPMSPRPSTEEIANRSSGKVRRRTSPASLVQARRESYPDLDSRFIRCNISRRCQPSPEIACSRCCTRLLDLRPQWSGRSGQDFSRQTTSRQPVSRLRVRLHVCAHVMCTLSQSVLVQYVTPKPFQLLHRRS